MGKEETYLGQSQEKKTHIHTQVILQGERILQPENITTEELQR